MNSREKYWSQCTDSKSRGITFILKIAPFEGLYIYTMKFSFTSKYLFLP